MNEILKEMKKTRVMLDENGHYSIYDFSGVESFNLYVGVNAVYGGYMIETSGDPITLEALEDAGDENAVADIAAILSDPATPWEACADKDFEYVAEWLDVWGNRKRRKKMLEKENVAYRRKRGDGYVQISHAAAERQKESINRWHKENSVAVSLRFSKISDTAVLEKLASVESKTNYIRQLILADIDSDEKNFEKKL